MVRPEVHTASRAAQPGVDRHRGRREGLVADDQLDAVAAGAGGDLGRRVFEDALVDFFDSFAGFFVAKFAGFFAVRFVFFGFQFDFAGFEFVRFFADEVEEGFGRARGRGGGGENQQRQQSEDRKERELAHRPLIGAGAIRL